MWNCYLQWQAYLKVVSPFHINFWNWQQLVWNFHWVLIDDFGLSNKRDYRGHPRNVGCISLFYRYCNGMYSTEINEFIPNTRSFISNTRTSRRTDPFLSNALCIIKKKQKEFTVYLFSSISIGWLFVVFICMTLVVDMFTDRSTVAAIYLATFSMPIKSEYPWDKRHMLFE